MKLASIPILQVWYALGGGELRGNRGQAFWRCGDGYSVSLKAERGTWYDFRDGRGGGVLALVQTVLHCDRPVALAWLETNCGLDGRVALSPEQRRDYARAMEVVPALAERLTDFARGLEIISDQRLALAQALGMDPEGIPHWHSQAYLLKRASAADITRLWTVSPDHRDGVEKVGRSDREHAERLAALVVAMLAKAQARKAAA